MRHDRAVNTWRVLPEGPAPNNEIVFPLLENGLDFLASAVEHLSGHPTQRDLKYALLHLAAGTELILKERLRQYDRAQLYKDPERFDDADYATGDFVSPNAHETIDRLSNLAGVQLPREQLEELKRLRKKRNVVEHFALNDTHDAMLTTTARAFGCALDFIARELDEATLSQTAAGQLEEIREALPRLQHFVEDRRRSIAGRLADVKTAIVECPRCSQDASVLDAGASCYFCGASNTAEEAADEYAHLVLAQSHYRTVKHGDDWVVSLCPECDTESLVDRGPGDEHPATERWVCFSCGEAWPEQSLSHCDYCNTLIPAGRDELTICSDCFAARIAASD
jgi:hypothetical protein